MTVYNQYNSPGLAARLWEKVDKTGECWLWTGNVGMGGRYGAIHVDGRMRAAHRVAFELTRGPIADGLELDHLCRNTVCVNPAHLDPVSHAENMRRGVQAQRRSCLRGHDEDLTRTNWGRLCRECRREDNRAYRRRQKAAA